MPYQHSCECGLYLGGITYLGPRHGPRGHYLYKTGRYVVLWYGDTWYLPANLPGHVDMRRHNTCSGGYGWLSVCMQGDLTDPLYLDFISFSQVRPGRWRGAVLRSTLPT